jgi:DNA processing protein
MSTVHYLALASVPGIGGVTMRKLIERFGDVDAVFQASADQLCQVPRISADMAKRLLAVDLERLEEELSLLSDEGIDVVTLDDDSYPANLRPVNDAPPLLFVCGSLKPGDESAIAIVGTREPTPQASAAAEHLACELAARGLTIVSGLALGIDSAAHRGALAAEDGRTLAVLGSGVRAIHPRENTDLAEQITRHGAVVSELSPNAPPSAATLMARDRIVSGLSRAVIVVEARVNSGSLDTADRARAQRRPLFAVPGSAGTELLLSQGVARLDVAAIDFDALADRLRASSVGADGAQQLGLF